MEPYGFVYLTTNTSNGRKYLGQTRYRSNLSKNYLGSGKAIKRAIKKYGHESFVREVLFDAFSKIDLDWAERFFIAEFDAVRSKVFYNIAPGGRSSLGFTGRSHTAERNKALSEALLSNHPRAYRVTIDGRTYQGVQAAANALNTTRGKIQQYLKSGIHPRDQIHGSRGMKRPIDRSGKVVWRLEDASGQSLKVRNLKHWCSMNSVPISIRDHQGRFYHGWCLSKVTNQSD